MFCKSITIEWNSFKCAFKDLPFVKCRSQSLLFKSSLLVTVFAIYNDSNFSKIPLIIISLTTSLNTSLERHNRIVDSAFVSISSYLTSLKPPGPFSSPLRALCIPFCINIAFILTFLKSKLTTPIKLFYV